MDAVLRNLQDDENCHFLDTQIPPLLRAVLTAADWETLLDIGCGDGGLLYAMKKEGLLDFRKMQVYGVDLSPKRVRRAAELCPEVRFETAEADNVYTLEPGSIDVLVSTMVLEHVPDELSMLVEIDRLLSPGGRVYLSTVFKKNWAWYYYRVNGECMLDPTHCREYTDENSLLDLIRQRGLIVEKNIKTPMAFPLSDFFFRRLKCPNIYAGRFWKWLRLITIPIPGFSTWELVCRKPLKLG